MSDPEQAAREFFLVARKGTTVEDLTSLLRSREEAALKARRPCACGEDDFSIENAIKFGGRCYNCRQKEEDREEAAFKEGVEHAAHWVSKQWSMHTCYTAEELADAIRALPIPERKR